MSVDTVNYALTKVRLSIIEDPISGSDEEWRDLLAICTVLRDDLMREDIDAFNAHFNRYMAVEPDRACFIMEKLFGELGFGEETGTREQLTAELRAADVS